MNMGRFAFWLETVIGMIKNGITDRVDNKELNCSVYRVKDVIRIDIKGELK